MSSAFPSAVFGVPDPATGPGPGPQLGKLLRRSLLCAVLWVVAAELTLLFAANGIGMSLIWPANGIAVGAVLAFGPAMIPAFAAAVALWHGWHGVNPVESLIGVGALVLALAVAWGAIRWLYPRLNKHNNPLLPTAYFHLLAVFPAATVVAVVGVCQFVLDPAVSGLSVAQMVFVLALSQVFGVLLFARTTQLLLSAARHKKRYPWRRVFSRHVMWWVGLFLALNALTHTSDPIQLGPGAAAGYLFFALVAWAAFAARPLLVHLATAAASIALLAAPPPQLVAGAQIYAWLLDQTVLLICIAAMGFLVTALMEQRRALERKLRRVAWTDPVTGRINEPGLVQVLQQGGPDLALLGVEAVNLRQIEDRFDFSMARSVENDISLTLGKLVPPKSKIARIRDGFFVLCIQKTLLDEALCTNIRDALDGKRYTSGAYSTRLQVSLGCIDHDDSKAQNIEDQLAVLVLATQANRQDAAAALGIKKTDTGLDQLLRLRRQQIECIDTLRELLRQPHADDHIGLWLACQPIHRAGGVMEEVGVEVLLRWTRADSSPFSPAEFLPLAERHGLATLVDRWVLEQTAALLRTLPGRAPPSWRLSVNLSGASVSDPALFDCIADAIGSSHLPAAQWCFELTETAGIAQRPQAVDFFRRLRMLGASTSLDDFGTGLASFDYLKELDVNTLKIDGSFVRDIEHNRVDQQIVQSICQVSKTMGLTTVAEFVEFGAQKNLLAAYGVDCVQGYGIARPRSLREHLRQLRQGQGAAA